jgi:hypothetical protein
MGNQQAVSVHEINNVDEGNGITEDDVGLFRVYETSVIVKDLNGTMTNYLPTTDMPKSIVYKVCNMNWLYDAVRWYDRENGQVLSGDAEEAFNHIFYRDRNDSDIGYVAKYHMLDSETTLVIQNPEIIPKFFFYCLTNKYLESKIASEYLDVPIHSEFQDISVEHPNYILTGNNLEIRHHTGEVLDSC